MTVISRPSMAGRVSRGLGWSTAGGLAIRLGNFGVSIIMARLILPEQFGVFAVALTVWTILQTMAEFGLGTDLVRERDFEHRTPTVATLGLLTSVALSVAMILSAAPISDAFDSPDSAPVIRLMSVSLLIFGFSIVPSALLQRAFRQRALFVVNGVALLGSTATMTTLAWLNYGPLALALGQIVSQVLTVAGLYVATRAPLRLGFDRAVAKESAAFCLPLAFANLLSWLLLSVDNLVVAREMSPLELGFYVLAFNVSSWPMTAIGQSIRVVALPAFAHLDSRSARARALITASGPVWALSLVMGVVLGVLAAPVITLMYGERWRPAAAALVGLAAFGAVRVVFDLMVTFLVASGATRSVLVVQVWWLSVMIPAMVLGVRSFGLAGAGWTHLTVALLAVLPVYLFCLHRAGVNWVAFLRAGMVPTVSMAPAALGCWLIAHSGTSGVATLLLVGACVLILYVAPITPWCLRQVKSLRAISALEVQPSVSEAT